MRVLVAALLSVLCQFANAQTVAERVYAQCTGPEFERQARSQYEKLRCHLSQSCDAYEPARFAVDVEVGCFATAVDICVSVDEADGCIADIIDAMNDRTQLLTTEYSEARARAALTSAEGFVKRGLERALSEDANSSETLCGNQNAMDELAEYDVSKPTICAAFSAMTANMNAYRNRELILRAEAEQN